MTENDIITKCPYCGQTNNLATCINGAVRPDTGHISICWNCDKPAIFDLNLPGKVRKPTFTEYLTISADPQMLKLTRVNKIARTPDEAIRMINEL